VADSASDGSLRRIAELSGYSAAAIYKFFDSKRHLVSETLDRRADEYLTEVKNEGTPLERLQSIVDAAAAYFSAQRTSARSSCRSKEARQSSVPSSPPSPMTSTADTGRRWI
jgi:AcrR family transcriptional regulator